MDRIKSKRKSLLTQRRLHCIQNVSNQQNGESAQESHVKVINKMAADSKMIEDIIVNELQQFSNEDIEWYNQEYDELTRQLNQYLVSKMLDDTQWDLAENYERELQIEQMSIEMMCLAMDDQSETVNDNGVLKSKSKAQTKKVG